MYCGADIWHRMPPWGKIMRKQVFISYRRDGGEFFGKILHDELTKRGYSVFFDVESMEAGQFNTQIYNIIDECEDFILILPPHALDRCFDEGDWVAQEIRHALEQQKNIIPVMMKNFTWPEQMPEGMEQLPFYEGENFASNVNEEHIGATVNILCNKLLKSRPNRLKRYMLPAAAGALILILAGIVVWLLAGGKADASPEMTAQEAGVSTIVSSAAKNSEEESDDAESSAAGTFYSESYLHSLFKDHINRKLEEEVCFLYADYDRDGRPEAFGASGTEVDYDFEGAPCYQDVSLYFIDSSGKIQTLETGQCGYNGVEPYAKNGEKLLDTGSDLYFVWEWFAGGVWHQSLLYGVQGDTVYSPRYSGRYCGLHLEEDHFEAWQDYPEYGHAKDDLWFMYDHDSREFFVIARTFRTDDPKVLRSLNTAAGLVIKDGSRVNLEYIETYQGQVLERLSAEGASVDLEVGSGTSVGDFEEQLIGHRVGETFTIDVEVDESYYIEEIAGKTVQFTITVNGIYK